MAPRPYLVRAEPGFSLPVLERLAPPPPPALVSARIDAHTSPGDVIADLHGRGGWIARTAVDRQRRAVTIESSPLARLLAEIVLRPPDVRHLDAAFQALAASPRGDTSLRLSITDRFASRCATCERPLPVDEFVWEWQEEDGTPVPIRKVYRCTTCRDQIGGGEHRQAPLDEADRVRAREDHESGSARAALRDRFPVPSGAGDLVDQLLDLHTPRQLTSLASILERIEGELRAEPVEAALRLAFLHAILPSSRLTSYPGRVGSLRISSGRVRQPPGAQWRERNPWLAFEDGYRLVRGFVQRLEGAATAPVPARLGEDLRSLGEGAATTVLRLGTPAAYGALELEGRDSRSVNRPRIRLVLGQPPARPSQERVGLAFYATAWALGRDAAATLPVEPLLAPSWRAPWSWQSTTLRRSLEAVAPLLARDARVVLLLETGGPEALVAASLGGVGAGYRLLDARLGEPEEEAGGILELLPPGAPVPPPRTRANVELPPVPGGAGDPDLIPGRGLFAAPERFDARPFSAADAARTVTETAVEMLRARGEPARTDRLFGEILLGLDRAGQLRRLVASEPDPDIPGRATPEEGDDAGPEGDDRDASKVRDGPSGAPPASDVPGSAQSPRAAGHAVRAPAGSSPPTASLPPSTRSVARDRPRPDQVERLVALIRDELGRPGQRRLEEIEPDRWWLVQREDRDSAALPLADRVEWAVYSLLSTAGPLPERAFFERIAALFTGHDLPDETLVRTCLESYRSIASMPERLLTNEDLLRRSTEHTELLALLAEGGHRLGMHVWIGLREQARRCQGRQLADWLDDREREPFLPGIIRAPVEELEAIDAIWYVRNRVTFLFEVEWTAMLGEPILRRHARVPQDERTVRFLVVAPERTELVRYKLERSPLLRHAMEAGNWHILKWNHVRAFLAREPLSLDDLEPFLGLDPIVERTGEQMPLFGGQS